jgi:hypothetical protein
MFIFYYNLYCYAAGRGLCIILRCDRPTRQTEIVFLGCFDIPICLDIIWMRFGGTWRLLDFWGSLGEISELLGECK